MVWHGMAWRSVPGSGRSIAEVGYSEQSLLLLDKPGQNRRVNKHCIALSHDPPWPPTPSESPKLMYV